MTNYFISDLHLEPYHTKMLDGFLGLMNQIKGAENLYILGDFFNTWVGDDFEDDFTQKVKQSLRQVSDSGTKLFIMHGNRDLLIGNVFAEQVNAEVLADEILIEVGDKKALLMHGDSLCTRDVEYMKFRAMVRTAQWQETFLSQPLEGRLAFAQQARKASQARQQMKADDIMDVTQEEVDKIMEQYDTDLLIHGHTHRPKVHNWNCNNQERTRMVLGDWSDTQGWMIRWEAGSAPELSSFSF